MSILEYFCRSFKNNIHAIIIGPMIVIASISDVDAHPSCYGTSEPSTANLNFCSEYSGETCCTPEEDDAIHQQYDAIANINAENVSCKAAVKQRLCGKCSPYETHLFARLEASGTGYSANPFLCEGFCSTIATQCTQPSVKSAINFTDGLTCNVTSSTTPGGDVSSPPWCLPVTNLSQNLNTGLVDFLPGFKAANITDLRYLPNSNDNMYYVGTQEGVIYKVDSANPSGGISNKWFDLRSKVFAKIELGLLAFQFDPDFATNGYIYVYYTRQEADPLTNGKRRVNYLSRFTLSSNSQSIDTTSECPMLRFIKSGWNHNGSDIFFDSNKNLIISIGDGASQNGGSVGSPEDSNGQNMSILLGKILRITPNRTSSCDKNPVFNDYPTANPSTLLTNNYTIPLDNPFLNNSSYPQARPEIYAYGFRNPWSCGLDNSGQMYCGDVGQNKWEEIDEIIAGKNYGWNYIEGDLCYATDPSLCNVLSSSSNYQRPVYTYPHASNSGDDMRPGEDIFGFTVIYGHQYKGTLEPGLEDHHIFGDFYGGIYAIKPSTIIGNDYWKPGDTVLATPTPFFSRIREGKDNESLFAQYDAAGKIFKLTDSGSKFCGNYKCDLGESCTSCPFDCAGQLTGPNSGKYCCANGLCESGTCPTMSSMNGVHSVCVGKLHQAPICGNYICEVTEEFSNCPYDCPGHKASGNNVSNNYECIGPNTDGGPVTCVDETDGAVCATVDCLRGNKSGPGRVK